MIPIKKLRATNLASAKPGDFFMPRNAGDAAFLVGTLNKQFAVAVALDRRPYTFHDLPHQDGRRGFVVNDYELLVDPKSAGPYRFQEDEKAETGAIVMAEDRVGIYAMSGGHTKHIVMLSGDQISDETRDAVIFNEWRLRTRVGEADTFELFRYQPYTGEGSPR